MINLSNLKIEKTLINKGKISCQICNYHKNNVEIHKKQALKHFLRLDKEKTVFYNIKKRKSERQL